VVKGWIGWKIMISNKFEITIKCRNCGSEMNIYINGWASHTYDDCDDDIKLEINCEACGNQEVVIV